MLLTNVLAITVILYSFSKVWLFLLKIECTFLTISTRPHWIFKCLCGIHSFQVKKWNYKSRNLRRLKKKRPLVLLILYWKVQLFLQLFGIAEKIKIWIENRSNFWHPPTPILDPFKRDTSKVSMWPKFNAKLQTLCFFGEFKVRSKIAIFWHFSKMSFS